MPRSCSTDGRPSVTRWVGQSESLTEDTRYQSERGLAESQIDAITAAQQMRCDDATVGRAMVRNTRTSKKAQEKEKKDKGTRQQKR